MTRTGRIEPRALSKARAMRAGMTDAERRLWQAIRQRHLLGRRFRRQHVLGPYIVDFICLEANLIIEVDGGQHADRADSDDRRTRWLEQKGYRVLRFWNNEVLTELEAVLEDIAKALDRGPVPE